jgi:hypothetical protein
MARHMRLTSCVYVCGIGTRVPIQVRSVADGYSACIFAFGQTGSGKTHTMQVGAVPDLL